MRKKKSVEIENVLEGKGYEQVYDRNIWVDPNAFFGHLNLDVFVKCFQGQYVIQISTDGGAEIEGSEINMTVYFGKFGTTWMSIPWLSYQHTDPGRVVDSLETFARSEYEGRKKNAQYL